MSKNFDLLHRARILNKAGLFTKTGADFLSRIAFSEDKSIGRCRFHGIVAHGRGRYVTLSYSAYLNCRALLVFLDVPFTEGNDAPRGGKTGHFFEFKHADFVEGLYRYGAYLASKSAS